MDEDVGASKGGSTAAQEVAPSVDDGAVALDDGKEDVEADGDADGAGADGGDGADGEGSVSAPAIVNGTAKVKSGVVLPTVITVDTSIKAEQDDSADEDDNNNNNNNAGLELSNSNKGSDSAASQARTPKHANKNSEETSTSDNNDKPIKQDGSSGGAAQSSHVPHGHAAYFAPRAFDGRMGGPSGAFQPHETQRHASYQQQQANRMPPMQVSPGSSARYYNPVSAGGGYGSSSRFGPPPHGPYDQQFAMGGVPQPPSLQRGAPYVGQPHPMYNPQQQHYESGGAPSWGPPPSFPHGRPPTYPPMPPQQQDYATQQASHHAPHQQQPPSQHGHGGAHASVSRAVSSSFDRSIKSTGRDDHKTKSMDLSPQLEPANDNASAGDASWGQLNQVASVDEEEMRKRLSSSKERDDTNTPVESHHHRHHHHKELKVAASNSSSLTNSPTEHVVVDSNNIASGSGIKKNLPNKQQSSSLDSLSSVASTQVPMEASDSTHHHHKAKSSSTDDGRKSFSPNEAGSHGSLDLMKCASSSSALLLPSHQRVDFSFVAATAKRSHDDDDDDEEEEARGDVDTNANDKEDPPEIRKAPSDDRPKKKGRVGSTKKSSPLSIECSPPTSPSAVHNNKDKIKQPQALYTHHHHRHPSHQDVPTSMDSFYDKAPSYSYSMDSAPPMPSHHGHHRGGGGGGVNGRPGSSSSNITPMHVEGGPPNTTTGGGAAMQPHHHSHHHNDSSNRQQPGVGTMPSWELQGQDSFGGASAHNNGGGALMSSFSFTQEYPMLGASASVDQGTGGGIGQGHHGVQQQHPHPHLESRNQSFEGAHYHRSDSMMSYEGHPSSSMPPFDGRGGGVGGGSYHGPFPPQAASWGSSSSFPQHGNSGYGYNYPSHGPMMRNFSEDSGRTSPPPHGMRVMHSGFQPPPEFRAPPSMVSKGAPQPQHILSSPYSGGGPGGGQGKGGSYGWSKGEDIRLTEIMKKYKNPRDWEPVAKEHNCGRSAKECHERWIRYLKPGVRKGQWTDHEDAIVMEVVTSSSEQPFNRWSDLAQRLPGRVGKQIRDRWVNHLNPNINHLPFSREDDLLLWEGHKKLGKRWVEISTKNFNSSRSENHIKNRWYSASFKKFITNEFGADAYSGGKGSASKGKDSPSKKKKSSSPSKRQGPALDDASKMDEEGIAV